MRAAIHAMQPLVVVTLSCLWPTLATAKPEGPKVLCAEYPEASVCREAAPDCTYCHGVPPLLNVFGLDVEEALQAIPGYDVSAYERSLPAALRAVESLDSDGDGIDNAAEIEAGTAPSLAEPKPGAGVEIRWDAETAFRRVGALFCGQTPSFEQSEAFRAAQDQAQAVHALLSDCLTSDYWRNEALHRLADPKIKPLKVVGLDGSIVLADYAWDYRLFSYALTDDRDARDLLLAEYHVTADGKVTTAIIPRQRPFVFSADLISIGSGQPLPASRRAGMITTQWFLAMNTMFSRLPRTTAAQAYRAYLGLDIAASQGLLPVAGEPRDVDGKGVKQAECAACHSTLDPLSYAFSTYNGIPVDANTLSLANVPLIFGNPLGAYNGWREPWESDGSLFGEPIVDLRQWAALAADSDAFKKNLTLMFYRYAMGRDPQAHEAAAFEALWRSLPEDGHSANRLLHRLIDQPAFGSN
jgi:hypothetical protein